MRRVHFFRAGSTRKGQAVVVKPLKRQQPRSARRILCCRAEPDLPHPHPDETTVV